MRAECELQPWMQVCEIRLVWLKVDCLIYEPKNEVVEEEEEWDGRLSLWVVIPVQILASFFEWHVVLILTLPW